MRTIGGIDIVEGDELKILGRTYVSHIQDDLAGEFVVWSDKNSLMSVYATPNWECEGIPFLVEYDYVTITTESYEGKVENYEHYKKIVKEKLEESFENLPKCSCARGDPDMVNYTPAIALGFAICKFCHKVVTINNVIGEKTDIGMIDREEIPTEDKEILNADKVAEELNKLVDHYFEEKAKELKLDYGDMAPEQCFDLEDAITKIAHIVCKWASQNRKLSPGELAEHNDAGKMEAGNEV